MRATVKKFSNDRFTVFLDGLSIGARKSVGAAVRFAKSRGATVVKVDTRDMSYAYHDDLGRPVHVPVDGTGLVYMA